MEKEKEVSLNLKIEFIAKKFLEKTKDKEIQVISHFDTDGITSATIMIQALKKLDKKFSLKVIKSLEKNFILQLPKDKPILFLDLASGSLECIEKAGLKNVFIIDHHEIDKKLIQKEIPENIEIINSYFYKKNISSSGLTYLFCKKINSENKKFVKLAILGMVGDRLEKGIYELDEEILNNDEIKIKKGLLIYPSTRPINRTLEFCSNPYIPEVTGNAKGVLKLLRECNIKSIDGKYKCLLEFNHEEMSKLITAILLRNPQSKNEKIIGDIFLLKFFNKLEDARELSAIINACSRSGESNIAIQLCMEISEIRKKAESIYAKHKQSLIAGLKFILETEKIEGKGFVIINAKNNIRDTILGTITSIVASSPLYDEGTIITTMAQYDDKIKVSARSVGRNGRNVREILNNVIKIVGGEIGGHEFAAGCIVAQNKEWEFINILKKNLEIELVKI